MKRVIVAIFLLLACRRSETLSEPWFTNLPPCAVPAPIDMHGWKTVRAIGRGITFKTPPRFEAVPVHYREGGARWSRGTADLILRYGRWGIYAFDGMERKCRTVVDGMPIIEMTAPGETGTFEQGWFVDSNMLLRLKSDDPADARLFPAIIASAGR